MNGDTGHSFDGRFLRRLERLTLRTRRVAGLVGGKPGSLRVPAADFVDYRPYSPGDDPRHIHWPAVARLDEVNVKVGRAPRAAEVCLLLDASRSMTVDPRTARLAVELAAALGWIALYSGDRLSAVRFADRVLDSWGPAAGSGRGPGLLSYLGHPCTAAAGSGGTRLEAACATAARLAPAGGLAVVLSDLWLADGLDEALAVLGRPRWEVLVLQLLSGHELGPPAMGAVVLLDSETGRTLEVQLTEALSARYREALHGRLDRVRGVAARRGARCELIHADWSLERAVVPYLLVRSVIGH